MAPLSQDTTADKVLRFAIGAGLGVLFAWSLDILWIDVPDRQALKATASCALIFGTLSVAFGNAFIEGFVRGRWWQ